MDNLADDLRVRALHDLIQKERDPHKLADLVEKLSRILEEKLHPPKRANGR